MTFLKPRTPHLWLAAACSAAVFVCKAAFVLSTPMRSLGMVPWIIDDAFIEMAVARNIALGHGFSYDWVNATTGSPFFWTYLTAINHALFGKDLAIQMTIIDCALAAALAALAVYAIAWKVSGRRPVAWIAFALATFSGNAFLNGMNGMETSFFTLLVVCAVGAFLDVGRPARSSPLLWGCVTGAFVGLAILTRADGVFLAATLGTLKLFDVLRSGSATERRNHVAFLGGMVALSAAGFLILSCWNYAITGSIQPANQVGRRELSLFLHNFSYDAFSLPRYLRIVAWNILQLENLVTIAAGSALIALIALLHGTLGTLERPMQRLAIIAGVYAALFFGLLVAYQWYFPDFHGLRYVNAPIHLFFVLIASLLCNLTVHRWRMPVIGAIAGAMILLSWTSFRALAQKLPYAKNLSFTAQPSEEQQGRFWGAIDWMHEHLPEDAVLGVRDHGRVAMFTEVPIQDLAGNIDPNIPGHVRDRTLAAYLKERKVTHLFIPSLEQRSDLLYQVIYSTMKLEPVRGAPEDGARLYRIAWEKMR